jgi:hypothetical protein
MGSYQITKTIPIIMDTSSQESLKKKYVDRSSRGGKTHYDTQREKL